MIIKQAEFIISAAWKKQFPIDGKDEVAFVGRSNVGKSSLINALTNRRKLVKVSGTPGKTRLVNFFMINGTFYFVDLPGYGYAKVSKKELEKWSETIENYLVGRNQLKKVILLVDSRHKPTKDDITMYNWIKYYKYKCIVIATKSDKIKRSEKVKNEKIIKETLNLDNDDEFYFFSSATKQGREELIDNICSGINCI
ncbi:ribosome biogenesis GTP-binding protein YihA/YsxC [Clostridium felsineum]|uniref:Probable GTP-binding protein EngB n=1 Tax=Clostridium felsineum TaxID=36839 RepID=A0A1S8KZ77_9CLOT|nr:ribosome biogenesis GTP-binding protein YihA/YsxC [Clostridium felsineum]MCR3759491.1 ribosome biogenesis GTP-binding protein YihA/YsxC [Clostridium felsineum]URZ04174.1 putative GTP-binding protein EngB [Clostridium felsineum]URZ07636.1 putative GTP-binding protein EngB [Clostridium felsineum]URZ12667.1 putative GTP-binding protein EngB [Clostridium felsineum]URZ17310.1 putative GTP-binding protein EngB [Clostridium felsineum DSM 794]